MKRKDKIKHKNLRIEIRVSEQFKEIIEKEMKYYNYNTSKLFRKAVAKYLLGYSTNWHNYSPQQQNYIKNAFVDEYKV